MCETFNTSLLTPHKIAFPVLSTNLEGFGENEEEISLKL